MIKYTCFTFLLFASYIGICQFSQGRFIENKGQWDPSVLSCTAIPGGALELHRDKFIYRVSNAGEFAHLHSHKRGPHSHKVITQEINVTLAGANPEPSVTLEKPTSEQYNFYLGKDSTRWSSGVRAYAAMTYHNIYPGIDLRYYFDQGAMKYDLIVAPHADPKKIQLRYSGDASLSLEDGCINAQSAINTITENQPYTYQWRNARETLVEARYLLNDNMVSFDLGPYDAELPLVIDPELIFSTFSGSVADNFGFTACFDDEGNLYSGGVVFGTGFPSTNGSTFGGGTDIAILKYDSTGSSLEYATFIGGISQEAPHSLIVNEANELLILGTTGSADYPVSRNAYDTTFNGGETFSIFGNHPYSQGCDIVVTKLGQSGELLESTFIGGSENDGILKTDLFLTQNGVEPVSLNQLIQNYGDYMRGDINVDAQGNIVVASSTESMDFPILSKIQSGFGGGVSDATVFSLNNDLSVLRWSTFLGGANEDAAYTVKFDTAGFVYVAGGTRSADFYSSSNALNTTFGGVTDGFITKIDPVNDSITHSTFLGTTSYDQTYFIDIDQDQAVFAFGQTMGGYPVTSGIYTNPNSSQFIHKLSSNLDSTYFSTVFGSRNNLPNISPTAFLANECGNLFLSGWGGEINNIGPYANGYTFDMPITSNALFPTTDGSDFYLMVLSADGSELLYATYYGSTGPEPDHVDGGTSRFDKRGIIYQSVCSCNGSTDDFPTTPGAWSTINRGVNANNIERCNNAAFKFDLASLKARFITSKPDSTEIGYNSDCIPFTVRFTNNSIGGEEYDWSINGETRDQESFNYTFTETGTYEVVLTVTDKNTCQTIDQTSGSVFAYDDQTSIVEDITICRGEEQVVQVFGGAEYQWEPAEGLSDPKLGNPVVSPMQTTDYKVSIITPNGCLFEEEVTVNVINETVEAFDVSRSKSCEGLPEFMFTNITETEAGYIWDLGDGTTRTEPEFSYIYEEEGAYDVSLIIDTLCVIDKTVTLDFEEIFVPNVFTPNDDGFNDFFEINTDLDVDLIVFDRSGKQVFEEEDYKNNWDGDDLANDIYFYTVNLSDGDVCNGWVQILR